MICPKCKSQYIDGIRICIDCNIDLIEEAHEYYYSFHEPEYVELVTVATTNNYFIIPLIKSILDSEEIHYFLKGEQFLNIPSLMSTIEIQVLHSDVQATLELLKDLDL